MSFRIKAWLKKVKGPYEQDWEAEDCESTQEEELQDPQPTENETSQRSLIQNWIRCGARIARDDPDVSDEEHDQAVERDEVGDFLDTSVDLAGTNETVALEFFASFGSVASGWSRRDRRPESACIGDGVSRVDCVYGRVRKELTWEREGDADDEQDEVETQVLIARFVVADREDDNERYDLSSSDERCEREPPSSVSIYKGRENGGSAERAPPLADQVRAYPFRSLRGVSFASLPIALSGLVVVEIHSQVEVKVLRRPNPDSGGKRRALTWVARRPKSHRHDY